MTREEYTEMLKDKMTEWKNDLVVLEDDAERAQEKENDEYLDTIKDLYRQFESIESRMSEFEQMDDEEFEEEQAVMDDEIEQFEEMLEEAREEIKDI